jgi:hypothetical protein
VLEVEICETATVKLNGGLMPQIVFQDCAVAFIDVLGFRALVNKASKDFQAFSELQDLVNLLESAIPALDSGVNKTVPAVLFPRHTYISDCIILSAPLSVTIPKWERYSGLEIVVMRAIQLTHLFLRAGYLIRGGVAVGSVWHGNSNIVGPAYQEAFQLEANGYEPCIVLSDAAKAHWKNGINGTSRICIDYGGAFMVNGLFDYYLHSIGVSDVKTAYKNYEATADYNTNSQLLTGARRKWHWFAQYIRDETTHSL